MFSCLNIFGFVKVVHGRFVFILIKGKHSLEIPASSLIYFFLKGIGRFFNNVLDIRLLRKVYLLSLDTSFEGVHVCTRLKIAVNRLKIAVRRMNRAENIFLHYLPEKQC